MRLDLALTLACATGVLACSAILGLQEPTVDNTIEGGAEAGADGANACTKDCLGGACVGGMCQPVVIAQNQGSPWMMAQFGPRIFWTNYTGNTVMSADKLDASTSIIAAGNGADVPIGIDADDGGVYFANNGSSGTVLRCDPTAGCNAQSILTDGGATNTDLRVNGGYVYYLQTDFDEIDRIALATLVDTNIASTNTSAFGDFDARIATDGATIIWSEPSNDVIMRKPITGGSPSPLYTLPANSYPDILLIDGPTLYFATGGAGNGAGGISSGTTNGSGAIQPIATAQHTPYGLASDATYVYWTTLGDSDSKGNITVPGGVFRCAKAGCNATPEQLASGVVSGRGIVVDDVAIYYAEYGTGNGDGKIWRLAK